MNSKRTLRRIWSSSAVMTAMVVGMVTAALLAGMIVFVAIYRHSMIQNVKTSREQITGQVSNIVDDYMNDISSSMRLIRESCALPDRMRDEKLNALAEYRPEVIAITAYDSETGRMLNAWTGKRRLKDNISTNLSLPSKTPREVTEFLISAPHVSSILANEYPWVVSVSGVVQEPDGTERILVLDTNFSQIAFYVDNVGIGKHGYCYIMDADGTIIYHPQQQLIFAGLKEEKTGLLRDISDGSVEEDGVIYTVHREAENGWRIVAVSYVDEVISEGLMNCLYLLLALLLCVLLATLISSLVLSRLISGPISQLMFAMRDFEKNAEGFAFTPIGGTSEMMALSDSFGDLVVRIQELMTRVRSEEVALRKTELRALQAQINPHFLYNTLDSIALMCEDGRNKDAVDMVNALARLFRISISKGHELIPIQKEVEHAQSYLKIQKFRYKNQFEYGFEVEEQCLKYYCNKITLQPIIENAIYHGLNRMIDEGYIKIRIYEEGGDVVFAVSDNGVGMTKEQCESILKKENNPNAGIGIKNVNDRVKIYFGERYGMKIVSELDEGTTVYIRMPKVEEGSYESRL